MFLYFWYDDKNLHFKSGITFSTFTKWCLKQIKTNCSRYSPGTLIGPEVIWSSSCTTFRSTTLSYASLMFCKGEEEIPASSITDNQSEVLFARKLNRTILITLFTNWTKETLIMFLRAGLTLIQLCLIRWINEQIQ